MLLVRLISLFILVKGEKMPRIPNDTIIAAVRRHMPNLTDADKKDMFWDCHGQWIIKNKWMQKLAALAGVEVTSIDCLHSTSSSAALVIQIKTTTGRTILTTGEASPGNSKNVYFHAMAEKRAFDRAALKALDLQGFVYTEEDAEQIKEGHKKISKEDAKKGIDIPYPK